MAPYETYKGLLIERPNYSIYMAAMVAGTLLLGAPSDIIESQIKEFAVLTPSKLCAFIDIQSLPIPRKEREALVKIVGRSVVERLEKRRKIANVIAEAKANDVYEIEEHKTGMLSL